MQRVLLKLSGEALSGNKKSGFDEPTVRDVVRQIRELSDMGLQISVVIGGGNFWRGRTSEDMDRVKADYIGMLATIMNCIYVADMLRNEGVETRIMTPFYCGTMTELFSRDRALEYLEAGEVVFFAGGTGHPFFSTDTATILRAVETKSQCVLMAKAVDGVYDSDPKKNPKAKRYDFMPMSDVIEKKLGVIDTAAAALAIENKMPVRVFALKKADSIVRSINNNFKGTYLNCV